ncbi:hypothetical protein DXT89_03525 [Agrobacterium vitis]|uniref:Uncharacterized protein n=1 Tax=Agrobacterium vitis TaxID=373 RepID=A0A109CZU8_AGRVI|nr:hypothetical protein DXM22_00195 [Agrobacterium vitis]KAA3532409.1 hypothetical protein DXT89_03525 [Agrobacterium vitis]RCU53743.1 hypothetical protein ASB66_011670 [Agrobacterium vitis]
MGKEDHAHVLLEFVREKWKPVFRKTNDNKRLQNFRFHGETRDSEGIARSIKTAMIRSKPA